jgi:hypothetical protein
VSNRGGKYELHIKYWVQAKERVNNQLKIILTHNLHDDVSLIHYRFELHVGECEALFLQMQPHFITNLKLVWNTMLVMSLLILGIGFLQDIMNLLLDVLDLFKKIGYHICLGLRMGILFMCICNEKSYINGGQWMEFMKRVVSNRYVEGSIVSMFNKWKTLI